MHQKSKLSIFKSNRSQGSFTSDPSYTSAQEWQNQQKQQQQQYRPEGSLNTSSLQASPVDSPQFSPISPNNPPSPYAATSSPIDATDSRSQQRPQRPAVSQQHQSESKISSQPPRERNKLRRRESYRSPPPPANNNRVGPKTGSAGRPPTRSGEELLPSPETDNGSSTDAQYSWNVETPNRDKKKKRRFFSFGTQPTFNSFEAAASPWPRPQFVRSNSVESADTTEAATAASRSSLDSATVHDHTSTSQFGSPDEESSATRLARKIQNRHSVAFPTPNIPEGARSLIAPTAFVIPQHSQDGREDPNAAAAFYEFASLGKAPTKIQTWDKPGRTPYHAAHLSEHSYQVSQQSLSTVSTGRKPDLFYTDSQPSIGSRPQSRQSDFPPSPIHRPIAYHHKTPSALSITDPMASNQQGGRGQESGHQASQSTSSRDGQYGTSLNVNNQQSHRNTPQASPMTQQGANSDQGRNTPPPNRGQNDLSQSDFQQLVTKHDELNEKYRKVKKYYFDKEAQVQNLQNSLAHQRLAQSRTSLDDNEYSTRFNRLDGAINNLAFNIRKEWKAVPRWLAPYVNQDATSTVSKEMTAVGRACISRWIVDEIFDRYFHPGLEPNLSSHLKIIERNLRRYAPPTPTEEDKEALLSKISNWRLATLDGLQDMLNSHDAVEFRSSLTTILVEMLTSDLMMNLKDPPPPGLDAGVVGIIELAINIAANLPLESRDVFIDYVMPGMIVNDTNMKVEGALPPLTNPGESAETDRASTTSGDDKDDDESTKKGKGGGMLGSLMGGVSHNNSGGGGGKNKGGKGDMADQKDQRVRFAAFMSVELKGKHMLVKAPVYV